MNILCEFSVHSVFSAALRSPLNKPCSCCSGTFSSHPLGGYLYYPPSSCGSYHSNLAYRTDLCSPNTCQLGFSPYSGCQETSCRKSCYCLRISLLCGPCWMTYAGSFLGSSSCCSLGYGSRSWYTLGCGSCTFRCPGLWSLWLPDLGLWIQILLPKLFCNFQPFCYKPIHGPGFYRLTCWKSGSFCRMLAILFSQETTLWSPKTNCSPTLWSPSLALRLALAKCKTKQ